MSNGGNTKKVILIVGAVTALCVVELLVLFYIPQLQLREDFPKRSFFVFFIPFLLIPLMGAAFSGIIYGPKRWWVRALAFLGSGFSVPVLVFVSYLVSGALRILVSWSGMRWQEAGFGWIFFACILPAVLPLPVIRLFARWRQRKIMPIDAERWITERRVLTAEQRHSKLRATQVALYIPVTSIAIIFLFFPETWGLSTHLFQPRANHLSGYKVPVPLTWAMNYAHRDGDFSYVAAIGIKGIARDPHSYLRQDFSPITFRAGTDFPNTQKSCRYEKAGRVVGMREVRGRGQKLYCAEYVFPWLEPDTISVGCTDYGVLTASCTGGEAELSDCYKTIEGIEVLPDSGKR